jgi:xanthine phosphoribosyltransferase
MDISNLTRETLVLTWAETEQYVKLLCQELKPEDYEKGVIAVTRGGLVPTAMLSHLISIPIIETICLKSYENREQSKFEVLRWPMEYTSSKGWLVLDDIADTGQSFEHIRQLLPEATYVSVVTKPKAESVVDQQALIVSQDTWVVFPWEKD